MSSEQNSKVGWQYDASPQIQLADASKPDMPEQLESMFASRAELNRMEERIQRLGFVPAINKNQQNPPTLEELIGWLEHCKEHASRLSKVIIYGNSKERIQCIEQLDLLRFASASELPMFKAFLLRTTQPKSYLIQSLKQPLYEERSYCIPFNLASPKSFFQACAVAKTRLLADATDAKRISMYNASRDKIWRSFTPNESATPANILLACNIPYWSFLVTRTQYGEGLSRMGKLPEPPKRIDNPVLDLPEDLGIMPARTPLGTSPCRRTYSTPTIIKEEDLYDD